MTSNTTKALTWSIILVFGTIGVTIAALINGDRQDEEQNTLMYENETIKNFDYQELFRHLPSPDWEILWNDSGIEIFKRKSENFTTIKQLLGDNALPSGIADVSNSNFRIENIRVVMRCYQEDLVCIDFDATNTGNQSWTDSVYFEVTMKLNPAYVSSNFNLNSDEAWYHRSIKRELQTSVYPGEKITIRLALSELNGDFTPMNQPSIAIGHHHSAKGGAISLLFEKIRMEAMFYGHPELMKRGHHIYMIDKVKENMSTDTISDENIAGMKAVKKKAGEVLRAVTGPLKPYAQAVLDDPSKKNVAILIGQEKALDRHTDESIRRTIGRAGLIYSYDFDSLKN